MSIEEEALSKAKIQLMKMKNSVFYTTLLFSLKQYFTDEIPTAATDGEHMVFNPQFFMGLPEKQRIGVIVHEILHVALNHMTRIQKRHPQLWNEAGDYVINDSIMQTGQYELPESVLYDKRFRNQSTEQVYKTLYKEYQEKQKQNSKLSLDDIVIPGGSDIQYSKDQKKNQQIEKDIISKIVKASIQSQAAGETIGNIPGEVRRLIDETISPQLPWNVILQNYFTNFIKDDYSWKHLNRRYLPDYYLPSAYSESIEEIAIAIDTSGSVSNKQFSYFIAEIAIIQENLKPEKISIIDFDTKINTIQEIDANTDILSDLIFTGNGGTIIQPVMTWADKHQPQVLLIFTDGQFNKPEYIPQTSLIWLIHNNLNFNMPGEIIHYEIER